MFYRLMKIVENILKKDIPIDKLNIMEMGLLITPGNFKKVPFPSRAELPI